jgi:hypothetical protein
MDMGLGGNMYDSFVRYQTRVMRTLDELAMRYGFVTLDASKSADLIFEELRRQIATFGLQHLKASLLIDGAAPALAHPGRLTSRRRADSGRKP